AMKSSAEPSQRKKVLILGGGFGGTYAALELEKTLARDRDVDITMIDQRNFFLFTPMLHEVAASDVDITHIVNPIRQLLKRITFLQGQVQSINLNSKSVVVSHCSDREKSVITYDYLLITLGATANFFNLPGLQERALTMQTLSDAIYLR